MLRLLVIAAACAVLFDVLWFVFFARYNLRKGKLILRWVEAACSTHGSLIESEWLDRSCLRAKLSFASHWRNCLSATRDLKSWANRNARKPILSVA